MAMVQTLGATTTPTRTPQPVAGVSGDPHAPPAAGAGDPTTTAAAVSSDGGDLQQAKTEEEEEEDQPVIDIVINNVVAAFCVRCHLDLKYIAMNGDNVEYRRENGMVTMKLRNPYTTASLWSSGKITCTGTTSEADARVAARRVARYLQKQLHYRARFSNYRVVNVLGTCTMPFAIKIADFSQRYPKVACYEPELHPGVTYRVGDIRATLKIFSTGSMTVTAPSVSRVRLAIEHIFPLVYEFRKEKSALLELEQARRNGRRQPGVDDQDDEESLDGV